MLAGLSVHQRGTGRSEIPARAPLPAAGGPLTARRGVDNLSFGAPGAIAAAARSPPARPQDVAWPCLRGRAARRLTEHKKQLMLRSVACGAAMSVCRRSVRFSRFVLELDTCP